VGTLGVAPLLLQGEFEQADVLTAERGWANIPGLPFVVTLIRS
jgi:PIN domain nuclease of toxin-antitoxin system